MALGLAAPGGAVVRALMLRRLPRPTDTLAGLRRTVERLEPRFDGRLRVAAVDRRNGRRVVFGSPGAPNASVAEAVAASCTVPWLFAPVTIGGREYVDGGVWSPTNLDAAPAGRDTHVLCLNPTASIQASSGVLAVVRSVSRTAVALEALVLRRRGAAVADAGAERRMRGGDGHQLHGPRPERPGARGRLPPGASVRHGVRTGCPDAATAVASSASAMTPCRRIAFDSART